MISKSIFARTVGGLALVAALPSVALAHGDDKTHADKTHSTAAVGSVQGTVEAVTRSDLTLKDAAGRTTKVELDDNTRFDNSGKSGTLTDLRAGMNVTVQGQKQKDGTVTATSVRYDKKARTGADPT
jgi:hypothetical protein